jgi:hypothetical protein
MYFGPESTWIGSLNEVTTSQYRGKSTISVQKPRMR